MNDRSVNDQVSESSDVVDKAMEAFGLTPEQRRYRKRKSTLEYANRKSVGPRKHVMGDAKYGYRGTRPETGQEPAYNRPALDDWEPEYPAVRPACFAGEFCRGLSGIDELRVLKYRTTEEYQW